MTANPARGDRSDEGAEVACQRTNEAGGGSGAPEPCSEGVSG
jgi:hypothetical protein